MNTLKAGEVVTIKMTGEYVYFTGKQFDNGLWEVHRPKLTRDGISYEYDGFEAGELESVEEHVNREVKEALMKLQIQQDLMKAKVKALEELDEPETQTDFKLN